MQPVRTTIVAIRAIHATIRRLRLVRDHIVNSVTVEMEGKIWASSGRKVLASSVVR